MTDEREQVVDATTGEIVAYEPPQGVSDPAGVAALAALPEDEFQRRMQVLQQGRQRVQQIKEALMVQGTDYGLIPGTGDKPTLLKPGAEKLAEFYRLAAEMRVQERHGDGMVAPLICYVVECRLHLANTDGPVVATGWGVCSNWERKYRYRGRGDRQTENTDPYEQMNTILKMAEKRAFVDGVLRATASSALFTQDLEDMYADQQAARQAGQGASTATEERRDQRAAQRATAEDAPICPVHNVAFRQNSRGYYCAKKMPDGGWCSEKPSREWLAAQELR